MQVIDVPAQRLAGAIAQESNPRTWDILLTTPLSSMQMVLGNIFGRLFFVLALQCMSTLAIARRELNSWFWPAVMWAYMTGLAYVFALVVYQGGRALGVG